MKQIPSKAEILQWISDHPTKAAKRDIAKAFGIKGAQRIDLKRVLKELEAEGRLTKRKSSYRDAEELPPVAVLEITGTDNDGDLFARPLEWAGTGAEPLILMTLRDSDPALGAGDRILGRLTVDPAPDHSHTARMIRRIGTNPQRILGVYRQGSEGGQRAPQAAPKTVNSSRPSNPAPRGGWAFPRRASSQGWATRPNRVPCP